MYIRKAYNKITSTLLFLFAIDACVYHTVLDPGTKFKPSIPYFKGVHWPIAIQYPLGGKHKLYKALRPKDGRGINRKTCPSR